MRELLARLPAAAAYLAGPDLIVEFANDAWCRLAGDRVVAGLPLRQALPELAGQGRFDQVEQIMETGEPVQAGIWVQQRGAQAGQVLVEFACQPVRDAGGAVAGVLLYAADASAHVRDRNRLEVLAGDLAASEERYRTLFETMPQGIVHYDADGSIIGANRAAGEILGMDLTTVTSWPVVPEGQAVREDGTPFPPGDLPVPVALRTGEIVADVVAGVRHGQTGELRWVRITAVPDARDEQGRPSRAYAIFADLTEQRRTETALRQSTALLGRLREANVLGVVVLDEHRVYEANDAYLDIIGYSRDDLQAGRIAWRQMTPPEWAWRPGHGHRAVAAGRGVPAVREGIRAQGRAPGAGPDRSGGDQPSPASLDVVRDRPDRPAARRAGTYRAASERAYQSRRGGQRTGAAGLADARRGAGRRDPGPR